MKMTPKRIVFDDTPAFIHVPEAMQHQKTEVIIRLLEEESPTLLKDTMVWGNFFARFTRPTEAAGPCSREDIYADRLH